MKWFYISTLAIVLLLGALPFVLLPKPSESFGGLVVAYDTYGGKIRSIDPATAGDLASTALLANVYEPMYAYHFLKRPLEIVPLLAESMPQVSEDGRTYTIALKKGVVYHPNECFGRDDNGRPRTREMTAGDIILGFKRIADYHVNTHLALAFIEDKIEGVPEYRGRTRTYDKGDFSRYDKESISGLTAPDAHTVQIRLKAPFPQLLNVLAMTNYAPVPRELIDYYLTSEDRDGRREPLPVDRRSCEIHDYRATVGTGPYYLSKYVDGGDIVFRRNASFRDDYYPTEGGPGDQAAGLLDDAGKKVPFVDVMCWEYVAEAYPMWMLFKTKQADVSAIPQEMYGSVITPQRDLDPAMKEQGMRLLTYSQPAVYFFAFNMDDKVLGSSKSLRQGLCLAFDVEKFIDVLRNGRGKRAVNLVPTGIKGHDEAGPGPYAHTDLVSARAKLDDARKELVAAGVIAEGQPIPPLTLDLGNTDENSRKFGEFAQQQFREVGITIKVQLQDGPTLLSKMRKKQCQIYSASWFADYPDAENFLQLFYSPNIKRGTNNVSYSNAEFDRLYEQAAAMADTPERTSLYARMIRMISEDCPLLLQSEPESFLLVHRWVHNLKPHPIGHGYAKYRRIDVGERRQAGGRQ